jgi:hypothetical protein
MVNQVKRTLQIHLTYKIYQQKKIHVDDIEIGYKILGKGDPILFISGGSSDMNDWEASTLGNLSSNHTVILFETRGQQLVQSLTLFNNLQTILLVCLMV